MRVYLKISSTKEIIPFQHQTMLVGTIHKWLGWNEEHGRVSLFSFSRLEGGEAMKKGLRFSNGSNMFFSAYKQDVIMRLINGIQSDPSMFHGLAVKEVIIMNEPTFENKDHFLLGSSVFIKRRNGELIEHIQYDNPKAADHLKETILTRMEAAGETFNDFSICFDPSYPKAHSKLVRYRETDNKASWCPVIIKGDTAVKRFIWNVGAGNSTGIGFGALK